MPDPAKILARVRAKGANVVLRDGSLVVVNAYRLPAGSTKFISANHAAIRSTLESRQPAIEERAAVIQFEGRTPREWAEQFADLLISQRPAGVSDADWEWFIGRCAQIIDEAPEGVAA